MKVVERDYEVDAVLKRLGLDSLDGVKAARGEIVQAGRHEVVRIEAQIDGRASAVFIKRMSNNPVALHSMWPALLGRRIASRAAREWKNYELLRARGIGSARALSFGEDFGWVKEKYSYIVTERVAGVALDEFLDGCSGLSERRMALEALGREIRRMHDVGLCFPDLFARHVFVERNGNQFRFRLIDVSRLISRKKSRARDCARDLAALNASVFLDRVGRTDRLRVMRAYGELHSRKFLRQIARRMRVLSRRSKFKAFFDNRFARAGLGL